MPLTFIHAADFHLGADLHRFGTAAARLAEAQLEALDRTLTAASRGDASCVLICGDLFNRRDPPHRLVGAVAEIFRRYPDIRVFILPGTHDFLGPGSRFAREHTSWVGETVIVLNDENESPLYIPDLDTHLYFRPNRSNRSSSSPIADFARRSETGFHIGLAHGSLVIGGFDVAYDFPITPAEIETSGLDYLALGHWHKRRIEKAGRTAYAYSGTAQPISFSDPESGSCLYVRLDDAGEVSVEPIVVSAVTIKRASAVIYHPQEVAKFLEDLADENTIVKLALQYSDKCIETLEVEKIIAEAESRFLLVQAEDKNRDSRKPGVIPGDSPNDQLIQAFKAEIDHLREGDSAERSELYSRAAELGIKIIRGDT